MEDLLTKGRQSAEEIFQDVCSIPLKKQRLDSILRTILHPLKVFDDDTASFCSWLISYEQKFEEFIKQLKTFDTSTVCGLVWNANFFAYRCRDCGISPCMSLCADCFAAGNHEGHDFNMFKSQAGGACDCGDRNVMKPSGFCHHHGKVEGSKQKAIPEKLIWVAQILIPRLIICLYEKTKNKDEAMEEDSSLDVEPIIDFLNKISEVEALREIFCEKILSSVDATFDNYLISSNSSEVTSLVSCEASNGRKIIRSISTETNTIEMTVSNTCDGLGEPYKPNEVESPTLSRSNIKENNKQTFLQYLMEVLVKTEFPTQLATLLLQMLPNQKYKEQFTRLFCRQYSAVGKSLTTSTNPDLLSNHMVHVSVQLFSNEQLAFKMVKEENLLFKIIFVLSKMVGECLDNYSLEVNGNETSIMAVNCDNKILSGHCYWPIASDLTNLLSHQSVAKVFLETGDCLNWWMRFVSLLTGMNINHMQLLTHVELESKTYYAAFSIEFESVAAVMWEVYRSVQKMNERVHVSKMLEVSAATLISWYSFVPQSLKKPSFTFHLSLHRYFALFASLAINQFDEEVTKILPQSIAKSGLNYLVSTLAALQEIRSGFWLYNGHQIKCQAQSYMQSYFCNSMLDLDVFFVQMGMVVLPPSYIMDLLIDRFCIRDWFQFGECEEDDEKSLLLVDAFLNTILLLLTHHIYTGISEEEVMRKDIIANLSVSDKTHSQLLDYVPTRPGDTQSINKHFDNVLKSVSNYKSPAVESFAMQQGMYTLKDCIWEEEFDLNHLKQRIYKKSDQQKALDNYNNHIQQKGLSTTGNAWPPLRKPSDVHPSMKKMFRVLEDKQLHQILIFIIYKAVTEEQMIPESTMISTLHLLQLVLSHQKSNEAPMNADAKDTKNKVMEITISYLHHTNQKETQENILAQIHQEISKDNEMDRKFQQHQETIQQHQTGEEVLFEEDGITFFMADYFFNILFKPLCLHMDTLLEHGVYSVGGTCKHFKNLLQQLPDEHKTFLKYLLMYWNHLLKQRDVKPQHLPFVKRRTESKSFATVLELLLENFERVFQVYEPMVAFAYTAFDIELPSASLVNNAFQCIKQNHSLVKKDINYFVNLHNQKIVHSEQSEEPMEQNNDTAEEGVEESEMENQLEDESSAMKNTQSTPCQSKIDDEKCSLVNLLMHLKKRMEDSRKSNTTPRNVNLTKVCAGDGAYYLGTILKDHLCNDQVVEETLSPMTVNSKAKEDRKLRALEIQKVLMAEFASRQTKFMDGLGKTMDAEEMEGVEETSNVESYECLICTKKEESTENSPIGLIVLLQPSTVLGKRHEERSEANHYVASQIHEDYLSNKRKAFMPHFDTRSIRSALEVGLDCGINIQSCGHYIHVHCQISYFKSLQDEQSRLLNLEKGEFTCPMCRQISNGVLPILPTFIKISTAQDLIKGKTFEERCADINKFLTFYQQGGLTQFTARALEFTMLTASISTLAQKMEELIKNANSKVFEFYYGSNWKWTDKYFVLLGSLRQNLECEMEYHLRNPFKKRRSCFVDILELFQFHCQYVSSPLRLRWNELCYGSDELEESTAAGKKKSSLTYNEIPLLMVDARNLVLQFILTWPHHMSKGEFLHVIQLCFNLNFVQALICIGFSLEPSEVESWIQSSNKGGESSKIQQYAGAVWKHSKNWKRNQPQDAPMEQLLSCSVLSPQALAMKVEEYCSIFLKFCWFVQQVWRGRPTSDVDQLCTPIPSTVGQLAVDLQLGGNQTAETFDLTDCLSVPRGNLCDVISKWCQQVEEKFDSQVNLVDLLPRTIHWQSPKLISLPKEYDSLFQRYRKEKCVRCNTTPNDPTICLVCGAFLCFHASCCTNSKGVNECVQHSMECGCGTGVFLVISSSVTLIIRETRVTLWGSVYLDSFGEEDKDLRRGKPLFLSEERYARLEEEWRAQILDRATRRWGIHQNRL
ncbi:E3 ubiquitin-protein ligase ubr3-like [Clytia hemisphaerica]|uniref:E3 ubiquitin-protein ligase n=1 Tax=Clytia hemisphaerica TaxID=252671 RepID=A0A7M5ULT9_9CNID